MIRQPFARLLRLAADDIEADLLDLVAQDLVRQTAKKILDRIRKDIIAAEPSDILTMRDLLTASMSLRLSVAQGS